MDIASCGEGSIRQHERRHALPLSSILAHLGNDLLEVLGRFSTERRSADDHRVERECAEPLGARGEYILFGAYSHERLD